MKKFICNILWKILKKLDKERIPAKENVLAVKLMELSVLFKAIEDLLKKEGMNRTQVRQFWRDFNKSEKLRKDVFQKLVEGDFEDWVRKEALMGGK